MEDKPELINDIDYMFEKFKLSLNNKSPKNAIRAGNQLKLLIDTAVMHKSSKNILTNGNKNGSSNQ